MTIEVAVRLEPQPRAAAVARRALDAVASYLSPACMETLCLLTSELVTNALRHGKLRPSDTVQVRAALLSGRVRVTVCNPGHAGTVHLRRASTHGWGLFLVEQLSSRWGVDDSAGTCVWFELDVDV